MGTTFRIVVFGSDENEASRAAMAAFERVEQLENILSDYRDQSESRRLCRTACEAPQAVSPELFFVLEQALRMSRLTGGAFDVTVGPLVELWRAARLAKGSPDPEALRAAQERTGYLKVLLDPSNRTVFLTACHMRLDFGGIAKGYAADEALLVLKRHGLPVALVDAGGDLALGAPPPGKRGWSIRAAGPDGQPDLSRTLVLHDCAVATSGDAYQYLESGGKRHSHIINPADGRGTTDAVTTTVVAPDGTTADALATALSIIAPEEGLRLVDSIEGASATIVRRTPQGLRCYESKGFKP